MLILTSGNMAASVWELEQVEISSTAFQLNIRKSENTFAEVR